MPNTDPNDLKALLADEIAQAADFTNRTNARRLEWYTNALKTAALDFDEQGTPIPHIPMLYKALYECDANGQINDRPTGIPISTETVENYLRKVPTTPTFPVGAETSDIVHGFEGSRLFLSLDYPEPPKVVTVGGATYQAIGFGLFGRRYKLLAK